MSYRVILASFLTLFAATALFGCSSGKAPTAEDLDSLGLSDAELIQTVREGNAARLQELLDAHPNLVLWRDQLGRTLLHFAAWGSHSECIRLLIDRGAEVNAMDEDGDTPLNMLETGGITNQEAYQILRAAGAY